MLRIYLSGSMDGLTKEEMSGWRNYIKKNWPQYRYHDPVRRDYTNKDNTGLEKHIVELDKFDIVCSNIVLVNYTQSSSGTIMEIMYGHTMGKLVLVVNSSGKELISPWIVYHSTKIFKTIEEAMDFIDKQLDEDRTFSKADALEAIDRGEYSDLPPLNDSHTKRQLRALDHATREFGDVHDRHCCPTHGCKYQEANCTVEAGKYPGIPCELCYETNEALFKTPRHGEFNI